MSSKTRRHTITMATVLRRINRLFTPPVVHGSHYPSPEPPPGPHKLLNFLNRWGIQQYVIARYLGLSRGTFGSKIRGEFRHKMSPSERRRIVEFINSIPRVTESDLFDDE